MSNTLTIDSVIEDLKRKGKLINQKKKGGDKPTWRNKSYPFSKKVNK